MVAYDKMHGLVGLIKLMKEQRYDCPVPITGIEGRGKSTIAMQLGMRLLPETGEGRFDLENNVVYKTSEVFKKIDELPESNVLVLDEAINSMYNLDFAKGTNKDLKKTFAKVRFKKHAFFFCIPSLWMLDKFFKFHRARYWIHVIDRGVAVVFQPDENAFVDDPWHRSTALKLIGKQFMAFTDPWDKKLRLYKKVPCYLDYIRVPPLPQHFADRYERISYARKLEAEEEPAKKKRPLSEANKRRIKAIKNLIRYLSVTHKVPNTTLADLAMVTPAMISTILRDVRDFPRTEVMEELQKQLAKEKKKGISDEHLKNPLEGD